VNASIRAAFALFRQQRFVYVPDKIAIFGRQRQSRAPPAVSTGSRLIEQAAITAI